MWCQPVDILCSPSLGLLTNIASCSKVSITEVKLEAYCQNVSRNLDNCSPDDKRLALDMLDIKAYATKDRLEIKGAIPAEFITIERTSA